MLKPNTFALLAVASLGLAATAKADLTWNWSLNTRGNYGSGTITTTDFSSAPNPNFPGISGYLITGATGTFDGDNINGVVDPGFAVFAGYDQILFPSGSFPGVVVDANGIALTTDNPSAGYAVIQYDGDPVADHVESDEVNSIYSSPSDTGVFDIIPAAAPEPSQVISMLGLAGLGGVSLLGRLRRRK